MSLENDLRSAVMEPPLADGTVALAHIADEYGGITIAPPLLVPFTTLELILESLAPQLDLVMDYPPATLALTLQTTQDRITVVLDG